MYTIIHFSLLTAENRTLSDFNKNIEREKTRKGIKRNWQSQKVYQEVINLIKQTINTEFSYAVEQLNYKKRNLKDYTISLFGRTKAGKSTLRETFCGGDGKTIGKGSQRTTRDVKEYKWRSLRLIDTPGIEAYKGEDDTQKAYEVIEQSDMVLFIVTDDAEQPGEFAGMLNLKLINKYFAIVLNVKQDLKNQEDVEYFLEFPNDLFDQKRLNEHHQHILNTLKTNYQEKIEIINIHAIAGFLSNQKMYENFSSRLWDLSNLEYLYQMITKDIKKNGRVRRVSTFFDGTLNFILKIQTVLDGIKENLQKEKRIIENQKNKTTQVFKDGKKMGEQLLTGEIKLIFSRFKQKIPQFIQESYKNKNAKLEWEKMSKDFDHQLNTAIKIKFDEAFAILKENLVEIDKEYKYDVQYCVELNINIPSRQNIAPLIGNIVSILGIIGGSIFGLTNPFGLAVAGVCALLGFGTDYWKQQEKKQYKAECSKRSSELIEKLDKEQLKLINSCTKKFSESLDQSMNSVMEPMKEALSFISYITKEINETKNKINIIKNSLQQKHEELKNQ